MRGLPGVSVNSASSDDGLTALHHAASGGHTTIVRLLLAHNANLHAETVDGKNPLQLATQRGHKDVATLLKNHGA